MEKKKYHKNHPDIDEGFGGVTPSCREYSRHRGKMRSTVLGAIPKGTVIGPVVQFIVVKIPDKGPRSMEISAVYMSQEGVCDEQDTENEYETETDDETQRCDETEQRLIEDYFRQRCEVKARRDTQKCCRILTALGRKDWKTWNDVPLELRKDMERIHRHLGRASADQLEKLFREMRSTVLGAIPEGTVIGPLLQFIVVNCVGTCGIEIDMLSPSNPQRNCWVLRYRRTNRDMDDAPIPKSEYNQSHQQRADHRTSSGREREPCSTAFEQSRTEETRVKGSAYYEEPVCHTRSTIPTKKRK